MCSSLILLGSVTLASGHYICMCKGRRELYWPQGLYWPYVCVDVVLLQIYGLWESKWNNDRLLRHLPIEQSKISSRYTSNGVLEWRYFMIVVSEMTDVTSESWPRIAPLQWQKFIIHYNFPIYCSIFNQRLPRFCWHPSLYVKARLRAIRAYLR